MPCKLVHIYAILICIIFLGCSLPSLADTGTAREYQLKAAYIYNFIKFIDWPEYGNQNSSINICVLGTHPFLIYLDSLEKNIAKGKTIQIVHSSSNKDLSNCNILYILKNTPNIEKTLSLWSRSPILTIGESASFMDFGGIIRLVVVANKIQVHINQTHAKKMGFKISGNLLEIAKVVR